MKQIWKHWARALGEKVSRALGEKVGEDNKSDDQLAIWRTLIILQAIIINLFLVINMLILWLK